MYVKSIKRTIKIIETRMFNRRKKKIFENEGLIERWLVVCIFYRISLSNHSGHMMNAIYEPTPSSSSSALYIVCQGVEDQKTKDQRRWSHTETVKTEEKQIIYLVLCNLSVIRPFPSPKKRKSKLKLITYLVSNLK